MPEAPIESYEPVFDPWLLATAALLLGVVVGDAAARHAAIPGAFAALAGAIVLARVRGRANATLVLRCGVVSTASSNSKRLS